MPVTSATTRSRALPCWGTCLATFFLLDADVRARIKRGEARRTFKHDVGDCYADVKQVPERAVAYDESYVREAVRRHGLSIREPIHPGAWSGVKNAKDVQDIVIVEKRADGG